MKEQKRRKYEAPKLTVVPLRAEERFLICAKDDNATCVLVMS